MMPRQFLLLVLAFLPLASRTYAETQEGVLGYYRFPAIHGDSIVFCSEGDLWRVSTAGGIAQRLTTHPRLETNPAISPDGKWLAFSASYEGPTEVYVMPLSGGLPERCTFDSFATVIGWTKDGRILYTTDTHSTRPDFQLCEVDPQTHQSSLIPLSQANDGSYADNGTTLYFTRFSFQGSQTKRYQGGTAQSIWRWDGGDSEARALTGNFKGTSHNPMWWNGRIYFRSDRDGIMNIWSMDKDGRDLKQHTRYKDYDLQSPSLSSNRIVYQHGADLHLLDLQSGVASPIPIRLASDFDQTRERWVTNPISWTTSAHLSPDGSKVALTARGQVFVAPVKQGRLIEATRNKNVRYRDARFSADGKSLLAFSDESNEVELWKISSLGVEDAQPVQITKGATTLRWEAQPSPDGKYIAHRDKACRLFLYEVATKVDKLIAESETDDILQPVWSPDSKHLAFVLPSGNLFNQIRLYSIATGQAVDVTTNRYNSDSPAFSPDGRLLYFLSDRNLSTIVSSPWGPRAPEPYYDKKDQIYYVPLRRGVRSPFQPDDELSPPALPLDVAKESVLPIDTSSLATRIQRAPIPPGNYRNLATCGDRLYFVSAPTAGNGPASLVAVAIRNQNIKVETILAGVARFETTQDGKKILTRLGDSIIVFDANGTPPNLSETRVNLDGWSFSFKPREEWTQMFNEAWRLHRDYVYDPTMHGVDWTAIKAKYRPLVDRVMDRTELSDVLAQMVGEVSLLHTFVQGGDVRNAPETVPLAYLGAAWKRDSTAGGYRVTRIYASDPDRPEDTGPLSRPGVDVKLGDVVAQVDGVSTLSVPNAGVLLRSKAGKQVRLRIFPSGDRSKTRDVIVVPISDEQDFDLRYKDWEYTRRLEVERVSSGNIGYVHLRAMGSADMDQFAREYYPVFDRQGLIIDVRHNGGGNIDSWILEKLMRKAWMYWNQRAGKPYWNMQFAFRGPIVVLCNEFTGSDGEAFAEGFRRLGLGKVIGTRTWGGEVWLTGSNSLVDRGIATAAEFGVYGPEGKWLIEGEGVIPDIVVDNLPRASFKGEDAQLAAAVKHLLNEIAKNPNPVPKVPKFPDKSFPPKKTGGGGG